MTDKNNYFSSLFKWVKTQDTYWTELAIIQFTEEIVRYMKQDKVNRVQLAKRLKTKPSYITKLLSGENNFTIETMTKIALALDTELQLHLKPKGASTRWIDVIDGEVSLRYAPLKRSCKKTKTINYQNWKVHNFDIVKEAETNDAFAYTG